MGKISAMKCLLLSATANSEDWFFGEWEKNGLNPMVIFRSVPKCFRALRKIWKKTNIPFFNLWYSTKWQKAAKEAEIIIVHMSWLTNSLPAYINKVNPKAKVIAWYWNSVNFSTPPSSIKGICEKWSFDPSDCKNYGLKFNHQYYFKSLVKPCEEEPLYDVYFCGSDSGRGCLLVDFYKQFSSVGLNSLFQIVFPKYEKIPEKLKSARIGYPDVIKNIIKSRSLLEITRDGQSGPTLRLMEALFYKKKVITTNKSVKEEPFYNPQNIFIIGERPTEDLYDFVKSDYIDPGEKFIEMYDVKNWLNNFSR